MEEHDNGNNEHDPLLRGPWSDADDGEDDRKTSGPNSAVEESTDYGRGVSGRRLGCKRDQLAHIIAGDAGM